MSATAVGLVAIVLWSTLALLTAATGSVPPFELAAMTFAIGGALGVATAAARGKLAALRQPRLVWLLGVGGLFGYHALYFAALRTAPPAQASLIAYLWPLLIVLLSATLPGERLRARQVMGAVLGLGGVAILILGRDPGALHSADDPTRGYALALCCAFVWAGYSVLSRRFKDVPTEAVGGFCIVTAILAAIAHLAFERTVPLTSTNQTLAVFALGLGPVGAAFYVWDYGVKHGDIRLLGVASYAAPVLSTLILVALGYAPPTAALWTAGGLIVAGAVVASSARTTSAAKARP